MNLSKSRPSSSGEAEGQAAARRLAGRDEARAQARAQRFELPVLLCFESLLTSEGLRVSKRTARCIAVQVALQIISSKCGPKICPALLRKAS